MIIVTQVLDEVVSQRGRSWPKPAAANSAEDVQAAKRRTRAQIKRRNGGFRKRKDFMCLGDMMFIGDMPFKRDMFVKNDTHITIVWHFDTRMVDASHAIKQNALQSATMKPGMMACR
jgi:hypothetical protein